MSMSPVPVISRVVLVVAGLGALLLGGSVLGQSADDRSASGDDSAIVPFVLPRSGPFTPAEIDIGNAQAISDWFRSAHANAAAEAFSHWDDDGAINAACATCHSGEGFRDFHGLDGTEPGQVDGPINTGGVVDCGTCHNAGLAQINEVTLPSGVVHPVQGVEASCLTCHQGRTAGVDVERAAADLPADETNPDLRFINPHYATAAATWLGGYGAAGYHYPGRDYSGRFFHARPVESCNSCHQPHTLEVQFDSCTTCHQADDPGGIRIARQSYDGSGNTSQGIKADIGNNAALLLDLIARYASDVAQAPVIYDGAHHPYFFADANGDGAVDMLDGKPVVYSGWTPRSLRAAFNWKLVTADPGNYAHNPLYSLELLHDSIADLSGPLGIDMDQLNLLR